MPEDQVVDGPPPDLLYPSQEIAMKLAIVEDDVREMNLMTAALLAAGHEVLPIALDGEHLRNIYPQGSVFVQTLDQVVGAIRAFAPDRVLLDHELIPDEFTGEEIPAALGYDPMNLVCISSLPRRYCGRKVDKKFPASEASRWAKEVTKE